MKITIRSDDTTINWGAKDFDRIVQNVRNIIRTRLFEVPFMRGMGLDPNLIDNSANKIKTNITTELIELISAYESRANIIDATLESVDGNGNCVVVVEMEV